MDIETDSVPAEEVLEEELSDEAIDNDHPQKTYNKLAGGGAMQAHINKFARDYVETRSKKWGVSKAEVIRYMLNGYIEREEQDKDIRREILEKQVQPA